MLDNIFRIANDFNDLEKLKIYNLISQKGGGNMDILKLIFGSILIVIGLIFIYLPSTYLSTVATVTNITSDNLYKYVTLNYNVNNQPYTKQVVLGRNHDLAQNSTITVYHDKNDPNMINLDINSYYIMSFIFGLFGLYIIFANNSKPIHKMTNDTSIYSTDSNLDNIQII
jgi:hypothetical protein